LTYDLGVFRNRFLSADQPEEHGKEEAMRSFKFILIPAVLFLLPGITQAGWVQQNSGTTLPLYSVDFPVNDQTGYAVGGVWPQPVILKTIDGGTNWVNQIPGTPYPLYSVHFPVDAMTGFAVTDYAASPEILVETTDAGVTWTTYIPAPGTYVFRSIQFPVDAQTGYIAGGEMDRNGFWFPVIFKTINGGLTWLKQTEIYCYPYSVDFPVDTDTGYVVGRIGTISKTMNGGASWIQQNSGTGNDLHSVHFPKNTRAGYAVGGYIASKARAILRTTDGGITWINQSTAPNTFLHSVYFPEDARIGYAVGDSGTILKTTDYGVSWFNQTAPTTANLRSVFFPADVQTGYAVGEGGVILKTTDGGVGVENGRDQGLGFRDQAYRALPNPFTTFATLPGHQAERFALYDITGRRVGTYKGERIGMDLRPGVYFIRALEGKVGLGRIVKVR
jgi:photosystem II stability/assembly factor-like uncharacterized protein